jgi:hypothetical protein
MAIFTNNATDALRAAIEIQKVLDEYNAERHLKGRLPIRIGLGIHTGQLIMGIIGDKKRMEAASISDTVNTASRIESLTKHFGVIILLSEESLGRIENKHEFHFRYLGKVQVKGKREPVAIYECFDAEGQDSFDKKKATLEKFEKGLILYLDREFPEAAATFNQVLKINPVDHPARAFLNKASACALEGVSEDWTGVEVMMFK